MSAVCGLFRNQTPSGKVSLVFITVKVGPLLIWSACAAGPSPTVKVTVIAASTVNRLRIRIKGPRSYPALRRCDPSVARPLSPTKITVWYNRKLRQRAQKLGSDRVAVEVVTGR